MKYSIVINACYGGFSLSADGIHYMREHGVECANGHSLSYDFPRHHPVLVNMVKELGSKKASGHCANLVIVEIDKPLYLINEYDGFEDVLTPDMDWIDARNVDWSE